LSKQAEPLKSSKSPKPQKPEKPKESATSRMPRTPQSEGLRERKQRQTRQRIIDEGLKLFLAQGFDATTLDAIAEAADISRRTFFSYFDSKEDIVLAFHSGSIARLRDTIVSESSDRPPLDVVRHALLKLMGEYSAEDMIPIDRLMTSTESLKARKQASYVAQEQALCDALCELWPQPKRRAALRIVAMVSIGALRLALEAWRQDGDKRPLKDYLQEAFANLKAEI
jgi:AcrR family transcriptional regulator